MYIQQQQKGTCQKNRRRGRVERRAARKHAFWTVLERVAKEVLEHEQLFVLMHANAHTGRRGGGKLGSERGKVFGAYGRDTLDGNGERLLSCFANHELALLNRLFSTVKHAISHMFNGRGKTRFDYIFTEAARQETRAGCYCAPPTVIPTYLGSQHRLSTCETAWSLRSQPTGEGGKRTAACRPTTTDD